MKKTIKIQMTQDTIDKVNKHYDQLKSTGIVKSKSDCLKLMIDLAHLAKDNKLELIKSLKL